MEAGASRAGPLVSRILRLRFTLLFLIAMIVANALAGTLSGELPPEALDAWGVGQLSVWSGDLSRLLTGTFLSQDVDMLVRQLLFAAAILGFTEWTWGSGRSALLFLALDLAATLLLLTAVWMLPALAEVAALNDVGMSMGGFGLVGLAIARWRGRFALFALVLAGIGAKIGFDFEPLTDVGHVLALCLGFLAGLLLHRRTGRLA